MGKVEKTRFERNWTTFVNPAFCPAWKSLLKMMVWNRPRGAFRSQGCFFVSPRWGKSKKRVLNAIGRRSSTRLFALLGKAYSKWWYETDLVEFDPKGVFSFRPDGESRKNAFWTQLDDVRQPGFLPCLEQPTQNGGMKPTSWNSILREFFRFAPSWGKSKKRVLNAIGQRSSTRLFVLLGRAHSKWWYETDLVEFDPKGVFSFRPDGESRKNAFWTQLDDVRQPGFLPCLEQPTQNGGMKPTSWNSIPRVFFRFAPMGNLVESVFFRFAPMGKKRVLNAIGRRSSIRLFVLLGRAHSKWWYETDLVEFDPKGVFSFRPDGESRKNAFLTQLDDVRQPGFLPCLEKPTQNDGMKPTSWNSIPRVFFRFAPMGKVEKTRFERNWTTFVNPAFCRARKSLLKMMVWNRPRGIRSQWCFFVSPRWGKSKKRVLNAIGRRLSTRLFALLEKAYSKWWYETDLVEFNPKGVFSFRPDGESRKNAFWTQLDDVRQPGFLPCLGKPTQNGGMKPTSWNSIPRVFFRFAPMGKVEKTRFERNWTTFVNPAFCPAWKSLLKMMVWNRPSGIDPKGVVSVRPDGESRKNAFWTQLDDVRQPGFLPCLEKPTQNDGMKPTWWNSIPRELIRFAPMGKVEKTRFERNWTTFVNPAFCPAWKSPLKMVVWNRPSGIDPKGVVSFRPDGESRKNAFWTQLDDVRQPGFFPCLEKPTQNGGMKQTSWNSIPRVFFRFAPMGKVEKTRFERNWTTFVNPAFCPAWKSPLKMMVWNRPRGIRS